MVLSGVYHGVNPGMGWPLAVSAALMERRPRAMPAALAALAAGHLVAMLAILLPFALMTALIDWQREIRLFAGGTVVLLGLWLLVTRRHPRFLARVPPSRLALWSFLVALAHGAALMLVPVYLGLCGLDGLGTGRGAAGDLMARSVGLSVGVAAAHTLAMLVSGGVIAFLVHRWLGLRFLTRGWFDLEVVWAASLVVVGGLGLASAL